jgi:hypothetical protein
MNFHPAMRIASAAMGATLIAALIGATPTMAANSSRAGFGEMGESARVTQISDDWARAYVLGTMINEIGRQQRVQQYLQRYCQTVDEPVTDDWGNIVDVRQVRFCDD